ncbi:MAG TPA: hypothetical protein VHT51_19620 [Micropepsaceae bacterium]|nr:hypothetical protein [Micropepsaceae bacterium]
MQPKPTDFASHVVSKNPRKPQPRSIVRRRVSWLEPRKTRENGLDTGEHNSEIETMSDIKDFEFSRIFGQGWNAAKKQLADGEAAADLNPYRTAEERARWSEGFEQGLASLAKPYSTPGGSTWRPAKQKRNS